MANAMSRCSRGDKDEVPGRRKKNIFRRIVDYLVCCVKSRDDKNGRDPPSQAPAHGSPPYGGETKPSHVILTEKSVADQPKVNLGDVTVLSWSRFRGVDQGGYPIILGEGAYGYVALMRDIKSGKLVAVKTWHLRAGTDVIKTEQTFRYELEALMTFGGVKGFPELIGILPNPASAVCFSLVQEFVGDQWSKASFSLFDALRSRKLSGREAIAMGLQTAEALREMHRRGWVHCDLKTDNVMIQKGFQTALPSRNNTSGGFWINEAPPQDDASAKLIDFGGARRVGSSRMPRKHSKRTKKYLYTHCSQIAPEIVEGLGKVPYSRESDVYSLGRLLKDIAGAARVRTLVEIANDCLSIDPAKRPTIDSVIKTLSVLTSC